MKEKNIKIYGTENCPYCKMAKAYFSDKGVNFEYFDVGENAEARNEMIRKTNQMGVPVIEIDGFMIIGFNKVEIDKTLAK